MKRIISFLIVLLPLFAYTQGFYIKNYHVKMLVKRSGEVLIKEEILADFTEQKRGIIRKIPFSYVIKNSDDSAKSSKAEPYTDYYIKINNVSVEQYEFTNFKENGYEIIRIGSASTYITGLHKYVITYSAQGIINPFSSHDELNWNIVGHEWDVPIENIQFQIDFEGLPDGFSAKDIILHTGKYGSEAIDIDYKLTNSISGVSTKKFEAGEGVTISLRFPKKYFFPFYQFSEINTSVEIKNTGACYVKENISVKYNIAGNGFVYKIPKYRVDSDGKQEELILKNIQVFSKQQSRRFSVKENNENYLIHIGGNFTEPMLYGLDTVDLLYTLWGSVYKKENELLFDWIFFDNQTINVPINESFQIYFPEFKPIKKENLLFVSTKEELNFTFGEKLLYKKLNSKNKFNLKLLLPEKSVPSILESKYIKNANYYAVKDLKATILIHKNKELKIKERIETAKLYYENYNFMHQLLFSSEVSSYSYDLNNKANEIQIDRSAYFKTTFSPLVYDKKINTNGYFYSERTFAWAMPDINERFPIYEFEYSIYDAICKTDSGAAIIIPLYLDNEFVHSGECKLIFDEKIDATKIKCYLRNMEETRLVEFQVTGSECIIPLKSLSITSPNLTLVAVFPNDLLSAIYPEKELELQVKNNIFLLIPFGVLIVMFLIWYFVGKDKTHTLLVRYEPPKSITPAEAGLLWDDKLHKRDMIALIYYWAAKGHLEVIESNKILSLKKITDLPSESREYEKTLFNALFYGKNIGEMVTLSSLRETFAQKFKTAYAEMQQYSKKQGFYSGFAHYLSVFFQFLSFLVFLVGILFSFVEPDMLQFFVGCTVSAVIIFLFSKIMIRKNLHATKLYSEIQGFKEFIVKAELDRLKILAVENPKYFEETIAYAIVLGYGLLWADKFKNLLTAPPSWYKGFETEGSKAFDTNMFTRNLVSNMYKMEKAFNYKPPRPSTSYSSSSSSSSSRSSSWSSSSWSKSSSRSSSWSGSSSFKSSSRGSSGSGYGGGGGSSW